MRSRARPSDWALRKAALIRDAVAREYPPDRPTPDQDGLALLDGIFDGGELDTDIAEVVSRRKG